MKVQVLKAFPYAHDGHTVRRLEAGDTPEIHDELIPGLLAEGLVADLPPPADPLDHDGDGRKGGSRARRTRA